ncbi:MAG: hydrogenase nickel incorporation protein HypB [Anaerolineaceae bacterium]|nr:hydrogenase nickel incorporation protein HypB [Anaerolineaceae bacterium]
MKTIQVSVVEEILSANDQLAGQNRRLLDDAGVFAVNIMSSPGAGKTSTIVATQNLLKDRLRLGMVDGDIATTIDADRAAAAGMQAIQINTGGNCHLDAVMLSTALPEMKLDELDLIIVENVGNLICPSSFKLGTHRSVLIASIPEGDDKPYKYPPMYRGVDAVIINKVDLLPYVKFDMDYFIAGVEMLNPGVKTFPISCVTGEGLTDWTDWLYEQVMQNKV